MTTQEVLHRLYSKVKHAELRIAPTLANLHSRGALVKEMVPAEPGATKMVARWSLSETYGDIVNRYGPGGRTPEFVPPEPEPLPPLPDPSAPREPLYERVIFGRVHYVVWNGSR